VLYEVLVLAFPTVGAFVASRRPRNPIGWILCGMGLLSMVQGFASAYGDYALVARSDPLPGGEYMAWISNWMGVLSVALPAVFLFLLFPDGHLLSRRWRFVGWMAVSGSALSALGDALHPYPFWGLPSVENPVGIGGIIAQRFWEVLSAAGGTLIMVSSLASVISPVLRLRRARGDERQQLKWFAYAATLMVSGFLASFPLGFWSEQANYIAWFAGYFGFLFLPVFMGIAILKYRLYDIDLVINRTLVYGALTVAVLGLYVLVVGGLGTLLQAQGNLAVSLLATGTVAVLVQPMRSRLQRGVNRLMYGERDEPYKVLSRLGQRLEGTLAPEAALVTIVETVAQALKLPYAAISLKQDERCATVAEHGTPAGKPVALPLVHQGEEIGQLVVSSRAKGESFTSQDKRLLEDLARQAGTATHAVRLTADLQHSRERLVTAREEERRRLRRDLHDGLGPQLASLTLKHDAARNLLASDPAAVGALLVELKAQTQDAISDIRRLVYDLRPPALDELGLVSAIREQATRYGFHDEAYKGERNDDGLTVSVRAPRQLAFLPAAVEVACYRIAQEAVTNVTRHAKARACGIRLSIDEAENELELEVLDDGVGLPTERRVGVGLASMRERAAELGGSCVVEPGPAGGTRVLARLPLASSEER